MKNKTIKERACSNKYCKSCLKNRYEEDIEILKSTTNGKTEVNIVFQWATHFETVFVCSNFATGVHGAVTSAIVQGVGSLRALNQSGWSFLSFLSFYLIRCL
jgi:hypothetical protein